MLATASLDGPFSILTRQNRESFLTYRTFPPPLLRRNLHGSSNNRGFRLVINELDIQFRMTSFEVPHFGWNSNRPGSDIESPFHKPDISTSVV